MEISLTFPEETAKSMVGDGENPARAVLELASFEAFRRGRLTEHQLQTLLRFETRFELWDFIKLSESEGSQEELQTFEHEFGNALPAPLAEKAERSA